MSNKAISVLAVVSLITTVYPMSANGEAADEATYPPEMIIVEVFHQAGATEHEAAQALAVAWHESDWRPSARNPICCAAGLFQITYGTWKAYEKDYPHGRSGSGYATDPEINARVASRIWVDDKESGYHQGWGQWSVANESVEPGQQKRRGILSEPLETIRRDRHGGENAYVRAERALCHVYCPSMLSFDTPDAFDTMVSLTVVPPASRLVVPFVLADAVKLIIYDLKYFNVGSGYSGIAVTSITAVCYLHELRVGCRLD